MKKIFTLSLLAMASILMMAQSFPERVYLCGPAGPGWATKTWPMYTNLDATGAPDGTYEWVGDLTTGSLKLLHGNDWEPGYASATKDEAFTVGVHQVVDRPTGADPDNQWSVTAGRYKLVLDVTAMTLTVSDGTGMAAKNGDDQIFHLIMVGDGCSTGWSLDDAIELENKGNGLFEGEGTIETTGEIKFLCQRDWGMHYGPVTNGETFSGIGSYTIARHGGDTDCKFQVQLAAETKLHFAINLNTNTMVVTAATSGIQNTTETKATKLIKDGQIVILKNGVYYNVVGTATHL